mmetsp:Transcript_47456/g.125077  ORF Transcript_47456/g.125077 Transcript_47456/m.125077 type:complete len:270 (+) Transcript_47456:5653-6462(+)
MTGRRVHIRREAGQGMLDHLTREEVSQFSISLSLARAPPRRTTGRGRYKEECRRSSRTDGRRARHGTRASWYMLILHLCCCEAQMTRRAIDCAARRADRCCCEATPWRLRTSCVTTHQPRGRRPARCKRAGATPSPITAPAAHPAIAGPLVLGVGPVGLLLLLLLATRLRLRILLTTVHVERSRRLAARARATRLVAEAASSASASGRGRGLRDGRSHRGRRVPLHHLDDNRRDVLTRERTRRVVRTPCRRPARRGWRIARLRVAARRG